MSPHRLLLFAVLGLAGAALAYNAFRIIESESGPDWPNAPLTCCRNQPAAATGG